jgi:hypothetical protein
MGGDLVEITHASRPFAYSIQAAFWVIAHSGGWSICLEYQ